MKTTRQTGSDRRLSLLQAALDLFATQGYNGTTTRAIAERSGVTEALLFRHFHTKQELLRAVVEQFGPPRMFAPPPDSFATLGTREALALLVTQYLDTVWANRIFLQMAFTTPKHDQAVFADLWTEFGTQALTLYTLLQTRSQAGELRSDIAEAATDVISAATSGFLQRVLTDAPPDWELARTDFVTHLLQIVFGGITVEK